MIYTVTLNPSLDYILSVEDFQIGRTNRTSYEHYLPGGKGINVSTVLKNLGMDSTALGFVGGFAGEVLKNKVKELGIYTDFTFLTDGNSRINVKLISIDGTEINAKGPKVDAKSLKQFMKKVNQLQSGDVLVLAGSIPEGVSPSIYSDIMQSAANKDICIIVDAQKQLLINCLEYHPFLIKPNRQELSEIFDVEISSRKDAVYYAKKLREQGARNVLVSLGGDGAVLVTELNDIYLSDAPKGDVINSVGAGDSMIAGFLCGWTQSKNYSDALKMAVACGSASAFSEELAKREDIENLIDNISVYKHDL